VRLDWQQALTGGLLHDGSVVSVTHPLGLRDATVVVRHPWWWSSKKVPLAAGWSEEQASDLRLSFAFQDVALFEISAGGPFTVNAMAIDDGIEVEFEMPPDLCRPNVTGDTLWSWAEADADPTGVASASEAYGGEFHSAVIHLRLARTIRVIFRDCLCEPSSWELFDMWATHPDTRNIMPAKIRSRVSTARRSIAEQALPADSGSR
jgi:hypothetical protein